MKERIVCLQDCYQARTHSGDIRKGSYVELYQMADVDQTTLTIDADRHAIQRKDFQSYLELAIDRWEEENGRAVNHLIMAGKFKSDKEKRKGWILQKGGDLFEVIEHGGEYDLNISIDEKEELIVRVVNNRLHHAGTFRIFLLGTEEMREAGMRVDDNWFFGVEVKHQPLRADDVPGFYREIGMYW